jgi:hypothetical protein
MLSTQDDSDFDAGWVSLRLTPFFIGFARHLELARLAKIWPSFSLNSIVTTMD